MPTLAEMVKGGKVSYERRISLLVFLKTKKDGLPHKVVKMGLSNNNRLWYWITPTLLKVLNMWTERTDRSGRDHMVDGFTTTDAISVYHHKSCEFESRSRRGVLDTTLWYKVCQWLTMVIFSGYSDFLHQ